MKLNKNSFKSDIVAVLSYYEKEDEEGCIKALRQLLRNTPYLEDVYYHFMTDSDTTYNQLCTIAKALSVVHDYSMDDETKCKVATMIMGCYARAFILCPMRKRHVIAYCFNCFLDNTYYKRTRYQKSMKTTFIDYCSHVGEQLLMYSIECDKECEPIYSSCVYDTPQGMVGYQEQRTTKLIQWFILCHIKNLYKINQHILPVDLIEIQSKIDECYKHLCNVEKTKLKKLAILILKYQLEDYTNEGLESFAVEDLRFVFNEEDRIEAHDEELEARIEAEDIYNDYLQSQMESSYESNEDEYDGYGRYRGSYAQDELGYSDDDIDTIFDGDPSAYWNID